MPPTPETTKLVRDGLERACREFTSRVESLGFKRTKKMFWTRRRELTVDVIHFHRGGSSYGAPINAKVDVRIHFAIRVLNDPSHALALNGPSSDPRHVFEGRYHLSFNAKTGHMYERCIDDLVRFATCIGEPWFKEFSEVGALLDPKGSPINEAEIQFLQSASVGNVNSAWVAASLRLLGIK